MERFDWRWVCAIIGAVAVIWSACLIFAPASDASVKSDAKCERIYGALDHPRMVKSRLATYCRAHGWFVHKRIIVDPYGHAVVTIPQCKTEDDGNRVCYWNAWRRGNNNGHGFIALPGKTLYVDAVNGVYVTEKRERAGYWILVPYPA